MGRIGVGKKSNDSVNTVYSHMKFTKKFKIKFSKGTFQIMEFYMCCFFENNGLMNIPNAMNFPMQGCS